MVQIDSNVQTAFQDIAPDFRESLLEARELIFDVARQDPRIGDIDETLRWGQPAYLTKKRKTGSTIRLGVETASQKPALFFICNTTLVEGFRNKFGPELRYSKNRAVLIDGSGPQYWDNIKSCILAALTYHLGH